MTENPITPADLQRWRELERAATAGPWKVVEGIDDHADTPSPYRFVGIKLSDAGWWDEDSTYPSAPDAAFIAAARTALPRLLAAYAAEHDSAGAWANRAAERGLQVEAALALLERALHEYYTGGISGELTREVRAMMDGWGAENAVISPEIDA